MPLPFVSAGEIAELLPVSEAVHALQEAFTLRDPVETPLRSSLAVDSGTLLCMPGVSAAAVGVKLVTVNPLNPARGLPLINGLYVLFARDSLAPVALLDATALTALRTSAVSALATRHLARPESRSLLLIGAGVQARAHLHAMRAVLPIEEVYVAGRSAERVAGLLAEVRRLGLDGRAATVGEAAPRADVICACTTSEVPVLPGAAVRPGTHVNAVGAFQPHAREVDDDLAGRARIVVEDRDTALAEAGDLLIPIGHEVIGPDAILADLWQLVGGAPVRTSPDDVTLFKSVGLAYEDVVVANAVVTAAGGAARAPSSA